jgi:hypothetical protein
MNMLNEEQYLTEKDDAQTHLGEMTDEALDDLIATGSEGTLGAYDEA